MRARRGLSLAEVAVALVLTSLAWVGVIGLLHVSVRSTRRSVLEDEARWAVQALADSADLADAPVGRIDLGWGWVEFRPQSGGTRYEAWTTEQGRIVVLWTAGGSP